MCHTLTLHTTFTPYNPVSLQEHKSTNLAFWHLNKFSSTPELFWTLVSHNSSSLLTRSLTHMRMSCERLAQWLTLSLTNWTNYLQSVALGVGRVVWLSAYDSVHMTQWPTRLKNLILSWLVARLNPSQWKESSFPQHERSSLTGKMLSRETAKVELITVWGKVNYRCSHWHKQQRRQQPLTTAASSLLTQPDSHWGSRQPDASNTFWNHGFREQGEGAGEAEFLHFFAEGLNPLGSYMVTEGEKCKVPHAQPAAVGAAEEIPF